MARQGQKGGPRETTREGVAHRPWIQDCRLPQGSRRSFLNPLCHPELPASSGNSDCTRSFSRVQLGFRPKFSENFENFGGRNSSFQKAVLDTARSDNDGKDGTDEGAQGVLRVQGLQGPYRLAGVQRRAQGAHRRGEARARRAGGQGVRRRSRVPSGEVVSNYSDTSSLLGIGKCLMCWAHNTNTPSVWRLRRLMKTCALVIEGSSPWRSRVFHQRFLVLSLSKDYEVSGGKFVIMEELCERKSTSRCTCECVCR